MAPPPRIVTPRLAAQMLLASGLAQTGWLLTGFGSIFFWAFAWHADLSGWRFASAVEMTAGQSMGCQSTRLSEGGTETEQGTAIYENRYRYVVNDREYRGASYASGRCVASGNVAVEYLPKQPEISRIAGMRRRALSCWAVLAALLPGVGVAIAGAGLAKGARNIRLLRDGASASGRLVESTPTSGEILGRTVYRMTFEYLTQREEKAQTTILSNSPERFAKLGEEILYDPGRFTRGVPVRSLPGGVAGDETGQPIASGRRAFLLLPAAATIGNFWYIVSKF